MLREYHAMLGGLIPEYGGTLEHFAGDGVMVFFNDPLPVESHELRAIRMALAAQARFADLAEAWRKRGIDLALGIGIEAGYATLGRIGFDGRFDYAALSPVVNLAARLSANASKGKTLVGQRVFAATEDAVETARPGPSISRALLDRWLRTRRSGCAVAALATVCRIEGAGAGRPPHCAPLPVATS